MLTWCFRPQCAACGAVSESALCAACAVSLDPATQVEQSDALDRALDRVVAPWVFGGQLAIAIRRLKFTGATHVARSLAPLWAPVLAAAVAEYDAIVVPVPLHWRRRFTRGFDHAWLLALHACALAEIPPPRPLLRRTRHAPAQSTLGGAERRDNLHGAFAVRGDVAGRSVIVVDDVVTTRATLAACAQPLRAAGATTVIGLAIATSV
jgi:ComF family protein